MLRSAATASALAAAAFLFAGSARAQASFQGLGDLAGGVVSSGALGTSADGAVAVGSSSSTASGPNFFEAFRWSQASGMTGLGGLTAGSVSSGASGASADGAVVVGGSVNGSGFLEAFRWTLAGGMSGLGDLGGGGFLSTAYATSADGSVVVGQGNSGNGPQEAFRWTAAAGMQGLGDLPGGAFQSSANDVSADGSVVVGTGMNSDDRLEAFRWTQAGGMVGLGDIPTGSFQSLASAVSADGSVVVGQSNSVNGVEPFRWTAAGGVQGLGFLPGCTSGAAEDVSADGTVVVGTCGSGDAAFIWTPSGGMQRVRDVLIAQGVDMTGWTLIQAAGVSDDGRVVVGRGINPQGGGEAFRAVLGETGHRWIDPTGGSWDVASNWSTGTVPDADDPVTFDLDATYTVFGGTFAVGASGGREARRLVAEDGTVDFSLDQLALTSPDSLNPSVDVSGDGTAKIIAGAATMVDAVVSAGGLNRRGGTATLQVFNSGTSLIGSRTLRIGVDGGAGFVFVAGGELRSARGLVGDAGPQGGLSNASIGNGGLWTLTQFLSVAPSSTGSLNVEEGGIVTTPDLFIAGFTAAEGTVTVEGVAPGGTRSQLFVADEIRVGRVGAGTLNVENGGEVSAHALEIGGNKGETTSRVIVDGRHATAGSSVLNVTEGVSVGGIFGGQAQLFVTQGGRVEAKRLFISFVGEGQVFVAGSSTSGDAATIRVTDGGNGECNVGTNLTASATLMSLLGHSVVRCDRMTVVSGRVAAAAFDGQTPLVLVPGLLELEPDAVLSLDGGFVDAASVANDPDILVGGAVQGQGTLIGVVRVELGGSMGAGISCQPQCRATTREVPGMEVFASGGAGPGGTLLVEGRVAMDPGATLAVVLAGPDTTNQGRLRVVPALGIDGSVALGGTLRLDFSEGYAPRTGDTFLLLDAASITGGFESTAFTGLEPGWQFEINVANGTVVLNSLSDGVSTTFPTPAEPGAPEVAGLVLHPPAPNPAAGSTTLRYELPAAGRVRLALYDMLGREVAVLVDGDRPAGAHEALLAAGRLAPGVYVARLDSGTAGAARPVTVVR